MPGIIIDLGTGDGSFVYALAKKYPDRMIIGIDPVQANLVRTSRRSNKNMMFVLANGYDLPEELDGLANQVFINFPWGSLLEGLVLADPKLWRNIFKVMQPGAIADIIVGYGVKDVLNLPVLSLEYFRDELSLKLFELGFDLEKVEKMGSKVLRNYPSQWAKKMGFAELRDYYHLRLKKL